ncbi:MAG: RlpA-like double-psi beta-barrel domain-containing protein [Verrucomicrobiales bacterium]|nr:RlpA-like double-psi beta-barrel domain-containing protein [Verrucomicrobiales bacterium]
MIARFTLFLNFALSCGILYAQSQEPVGGLVRVYSDELQGRPTASGELYEVSALTGAHATLPLGTMVRVANFDTGRMVDVRINDRKRADSAVIHLSRTAARHIGLRASGAARGSIMVIGTMPPPIPAPSSSGDYVGIGTTGEATAQKRFAPFQAFRKDPLLEAVNEPENAKLIARAEKTTVESEKRGLFGKRKPVKYGIPAGQYAPPTMAHNSDNRSVGQRTELVPLSAGANLPARTAPAPLPSRGVSSPVANTYRVQFGAFRRGSNAAEMNESLVRSGIATTVVQSSANALYLVVTYGGFKSAEEAQGWINYEGSRRGWRERPVVIR